MKTTLFSFRFLLIGATAMWAQIQIAQAQTVYNGSFEIGVSLPAGGLQINAGDSTSIAGWTITGGNVDYIPSTRWAAADGTRSLDLSGVNAGTIASQSISGFTVGQNYTVSFFMAGNPENFSYGTVKTLHADIAGISQDFTFDAAGRTAANMGWAQEYLSFTANDSTLTLSFTSYIDGWFGPTLDNVSIMPVPEPSMAGLTVLMLGLFFKSRGKRA